jgi:hypothetical protein
VAVILIFYFCKIKCYKKIIVFVISWFLIKKIICLVIKLFLEKEKLSESNSTKGVLKNKKTNEKKFILKKTTAN